jgi:hypothetical protein
MGKIECFTLGFLLLVFCYLARFTWSLGHAVSKSCLASQNLASSKMFKGTISIENKGTAA